MRMYQVERLCLDSRYELSTYRGGYHTVGLKRAREGIRDDINTIMTRNKGSDILVREGNWETRVSINGKEVFQFRIFLVGNFW